MTSIMPQKHHLVVDRLASVRAPARPGTGTGPAPARHLPRPAGRAVAS
ncbi:MAG TPA: hypothetical protein VGM12_10800 [Trebonia sp.]